MPKTACLPLVLAIAAASTLGACSDDDTSGGSSGTGGAPTITHSNIKGEIIKAMCQQWISCSNAWGGTFSSVSDCLVFFQAAGMDFGGIDDPALFDINSAKANACLQNLATAPCDRELDFEFTSECDQAVSGKLALDDCCGESGGCVTGLFCAGATPTAVGTCQATVALNGDCSSNRCDDGLYCDQTQTCRSPKIANATCFGGLEDECAPLDCLGGTCQARLGVGDACDLSDDQCPIAAVCTASLNGATCDPCPQCTTNGAACTPGEMVATNKCLLAYVFFGQYYCAPESPGANSGTCAALPGSGAECADALICDPVLDLYCGDDNGSGRSCQSRTVDGTACDPAGADSCMLGSDCNSTTNSCVPENPTPVTCP